QSDSPLRAIESDGRREPVAEVQDLAAGIVQNAIERRTDRLVTVEQAGGNEDSRGAGIQCEYSRSCALRRAVHLDYYPGSQVRSAGQGRVVPKEGNELADVVAGIVRHPLRRYGPSSQQQAGNSHSDDSPS